VIAQRLGHRRLAGNAQKPVQEQARGFRVRRLLDQTVRLRRDDRSADRSYWNGHRQAWWR
jgi:hypothetical protein